MKTLLILGSGTAGLVSALILRQRFDKLKIKIISSKDIGIIGVGEGTTEHWSEFTSFCGINVVDLIKQSDATFKFGVMFALLPAFNSIGGTPIAFKILSS